MRRLPIFFLVDVSESMVGENLYRLEEAIGNLVSMLCKDPYALEAAFLSVIVFAGKPKTITQLTEITTFNRPELPVGGGTALGAALMHLMNEIDRTVVKSSQERKGDWKPMVFLLTDGHPTDDTAPAIKRWNDGYRAKSNLVAISIGDGADQRVLDALTEDVRIFNDAAADAYARFIKWWSSTIATHSRSVSSGQDGRVSLIKTDRDLLSDPKEKAPVTPFAGVDDRFAVFTAKCATTKLPYVVKYERHMNRIETTDPALAGLFQTRNYVLTTAVPVKKSYFELSDSRLTGQAINSSDLIGQPSCPHCQARFGMAVCACGGIHCVAGEGTWTCPWCAKTASYGISEGGDGFDINRGRG